MLRQARSLAALALALPLAAASAAAAHDPAPPGQPTVRTEAGLAEGAWIDPTATRTGLMQGQLVRNDRQLVYEMRATVWQFFPAQADEARYGNLRGMLRAPNDIVGGEPVQELRIQGNWRIRAGGRTGDFQALLFLPFGHAALPIMPVGTVEGVIRVPLQSAGGGQTSLNSESRQSAPGDRLPRGSAPGDQQLIRDEAGGESEGQVNLNSLARQSAPRDRLPRSSAPGDQQLIRDEAGGEREGQASLNGLSRRSAPGDRAVRSSAPGDQQHFRDEAGGELETQASVNGLSRQSAPGDRAVRSSAPGDQQHVRQEARGELETQAKAGASIGGNQVDPRNSSGAGQAHSLIKAKQVGNRGNAGAGQVQMDRAFVARWRLEY